MRYFAFCFSHGVLALQRLSLTYSKSRLSCPGVPCASRCERHGAGGSGHRRRLASSLHLGRQRRAADTLHVRYCPYLAPGPVLSDSCLLSSAYCTSSPNLVRTSVPPLASFHHSSPPTLSSLPSRYRVWRVWEEPAERGVSV